MNTISLGFSAPSTAKSWDTGEHKVVDGSSQSPVAGEVTQSPEPIRPAASLFPLHRQEMHHYLIFRAPQKDSVP